MESERASGRDDVPGVAGLPWSTWWIEDVETSEYGPVLWEWMDLLGPFEIWHAKDWFPFQNLVSTSFTELLVKSERIWTWLWSWQRLNFQVSGGVEREGVMSMRHSKTCVIRLQLFSISRRKYHGLLSLSVPWKLSRIATKWPPKMEGQGLIYGRENS